MQKNYDIIEFPRESRAGAAVNSRKLWTPICTKTEEVCM